MLEKLGRHDSWEGVRAVVAGFPILLVVAVALLLGLLAVNERVCARLGWRVRRAA